VKLLTAWSGNKKGECSLISQHYFGIGVLGESAVEIQRGDEE
jgi:hypothetical protein